MKKKKNEFEKEVLENPINESLKKIKSEKIIRSNKIANEYSKNIKQNSTEKNFETSLEQKSEKNLILLKNKKSRYESDGDTEPKKINQSYENTRKNEIEIEIQENDVEIKENNNFDNNKEINGYIKENNNDLNDNNDVDLSENQNYNLVTLEEKKKNNEIIDLTFNNNINQNTEQIFHEKRDLFINQNRLPDLKSLIIPQDLNKSHSNFCRLNDIQVGEK